MNKEKFKSYVKHPGEVVIEPDMELINGVIEDFPYFQTAHLLQTVAYHQSDSIFFDKSLKTTAIYAHDRQALYQLLNRPYKPDLKEPDVEPRIEQDQAKEQEEEQHQPEATSGYSNQGNIPLPEEAGVIQDYFAYFDPANQSQNLQHENQSESGQYEQASSEAEHSAKTEDQQDTHHSFIGWLDAVNKDDHGSPNSSKQENHESEPHLDSHHKSKKEKISEDQILDQFIHEEPKMPRKKADFYKPSVMAQKSIEMPDELVSEPLAEIYVQQGYHKEAIQIYDRLSLLYPDSFNYFAKKIEEVKKLSSYKK